MWIGIIYASTGREWYGHCRRCDAQYLVFNCYQTFFPFWLCSRDLPKNLSLLPCYLPTTWTERTAAAIIIDQQRTQQICPVATGLLIRPLVENPSYTRPLSFHPILSCNLADQPVQSGIWFSLTHPPVQFIVNSPHLSSPLSCLTTSFPLSII
ncbi:hypothetical protein BDV29DRAFT_25 [Aspergillus leporis]|uniref:Uncharacterized protein n=1 Tax=Aspergillus leporis TaxID=41062 RepID=A0A5N5XFQ9_9EURO|nr:hypothetical protein BDV29DRAFT_25 [Aspergillus leporis]